MDIFSTLLSEGQVASILEIPSVEDSTSIGIVTKVNPENIIHLMDVWCARVDKCLALDREANEEPSHRKDIFYHFRGFTYAEFKALFNQHITPDQFSQYPIFTQIRKSKGGVVSEKQRQDFTFQYSFNEEDYLKILSEEGYRPVLDFFQGALGKLSALLPLRKIKQHSLVVAPSGAGKSELLRVLFYRLQKKYPKFTLVLIDPHGEVARSVKNSKLTYQQRERLIYFDPFLKEGYTPCFNSYSIGDRSDKNLSHSAEQNILALEEILTREGGKPTEGMVNVLEKALYFILQRPNSTIFTLLELFTANSSLKEEAYEFDPIFDEYFFKPGNKTREGIFNRISRVVNNPILRRVLGGHSTFDLEHSLNSGKLLIFNLEGFGEMAQVTFGKLLVASIKSYVRKRRKNTGVPIICMVDEAHQLVSGSFQYILAQLRGFGLHMILSTQFIKQLGDQVTDVKKNTAIKIVGGDVEDDVKEVLKVRDNLTLKDYHFLLKVRGKSQVVFKSPSLLINNPKRYNATSEQEKEIDRMQLDRYYKVIGEDQHDQRRDKGTSSDDSDNSLPKPPFDLFLGDDD